MQNIANTTRTCSDGILEPGKILYSEKITEDQIKHYELMNMQANVLYDIRISYPAYVRCFIS